LNVSLFISKIAGLEIASGRGVFLEQANGKGSTVPLTPPKR
jgi:hypothetical protein